MRPETASNTPSLSSVYVPELGMSFASAMFTQDLLRELREELLDPAYVLYQHGVRATRALGCKGPMCRKAARDYGREFQRRANKAQRANVTKAQQYDEFIAEYVRYAEKKYRESGHVKPARRKLATARIIRQDRLVPQHAVQALHAKRVGLAS